ncbi:GNAT family N-acetyltransferase [uncultured Chitinophaga sp.]|jgi:Acetyltransferases, including N-acetylases of ribosomal proteins|uniref:GNAT family N-acetyltransferase n=1 Tax=uncultured Chitinophaga sp. TaxID=339340 RepID=UPI00263660B8|nr:GNAT family N-acetyltransferase [uncultured Chitinophaga sp.]
MHPLIETERLFIRQLDLSDAPFMLELVNTPAWLRYIGDRQLHTIEDAERYLANGVMESYAENGYGGWLVVLKESGLPVGMCGLFRRAYLPAPDLGFAFLPGHSGKGYAYEAATATLRYVKQQYSYLESLYAITIPDNSRSIRLLEKCRFRYLSLMKPPGEDTDVKLFLLNLRDQLP